MILSTVNINSSHRLHQQSAQYAYTNGRSVHDLPAPIKPQKPAYMTLSLVVRTFTLKLFVIIVF